MTDNLGRICERAFAEGQKIDLEGCYYGPSQATGQFFDKPQSYQFFLAGFVRSMKLTYLLEIGTHFGGGIMSMSRGLYHQEYEKCKLATVDVTYENIDGFKSYPYIKRIQGDALNHDTAARVKAFFDKSIDLLYLDSTHTYEHTILCICLYASTLKPKYIICDEIHFNHSMNRLWHKLGEELRLNVFDATEICKRGPRGFGVIEWGNRVMDLKKGEKLWSEILGVCEGVLRMLPKPMEQGFRNYLGKIL